MWDESQYCGKLIISAANRIYMIATNLQWDKTVRREKHLYEAYGSRASP